MGEYPELLPGVSLPALKDVDIRGFFLVRETARNIYELLDEGYSVDDIIEEVIKPQPSLKEVYELSLYLFGYYSEKHVGIRDTEKKEEKWFPLFLSAAALFKKNINFNENQYLLSFVHTPNYDNFWHCELFINDQETGEKIPRDIKHRKSHYRLLAKHVLGQYVTKAICKKSEVIPFRRADFDKMLKCE